MTSAPPAVDLTHCDAEPIHIPGAIQPHGVLFALHEADLTIAHVSENLAACLGMPAAQALGLPLASILDPASAEAVRAALSAPRLDDLNPLSLHAGGRRFDGILHRHAGATILEMEPAPAAGAPAGIHHPLRAALGRIEASRSLVELFQTVVAEVRDLTGFDRVMIYRFDASGHGEVVAEALREGLDPFLGLHYPASDIPRQARRLYLMSWLRIIPDARYTPARIVPALRAASGQPLDLSFSVLRSVSPIHLEYMANMGIVASMSVSLIVRGRLWGLISCHHLGPRFVPFEIRSSCETLGKLMSLQIAALEEIDARAAREERRPTLEALVAAMREGAGDVLATLAAHPTDLLGLVRASGAAILAGEQCHTVGRTPDQAAVRDIVPALSPLEREGVSCTNALGSLWPGAEAFREVACGVLSIALPEPRASRILWFRPEVVQTVDWGGDPQKPAEPDPSGPRLHPRRSFARWREEVRLTSIAWTPAEVEVAADLRRYAIEIDLARQVVRERRAVQARDDLMAVVSHDLRNPLGVIQMQAAVLLHLGTGEAARSRRLRASAERIQRGVDRMNALIHDLLDIAKIEAGRFSVEPEPLDAGELIEETLGILRPLTEGKALRLTHGVSPELRVRADRERIFQVLSNLVGNAIKFTPPKGTIRLTVEAAGNDAIFTVADTGPGIPADEILHIFDRGWQAKRSGRESAGLGLYIVKGIVEAHRGRVWVESAVGQGSAFHFTLPLA